MCALLASVRLSSLLAFSALTGTPSMKVTPPPAHLTKQRGRADRPHSSRTPRCSRNHLPTTTAAGPGGGPWRWGWDIIKSEMGWCRRNGRERRGWVDAPTCDPETQTEVNLLFHPLPMAPHQSWRETSWKKKECLIMSRVTNLLIPLKKDVVCVFQKHHGQRKETRVWSEIHNDRRNYYRQHLWSMASFQPVLNKMISTHFIIQSL